MLAEVLKIKFPEIDLNPVSGNACLKDHGDGPIVDKWELPQYPKPTPEELKEWNRELDPLIQRDRKVRDIQARLVEIDMKSIRALRANDSARLAELEQQATKLRAQL